MHNRYRRNKNGRLKNIKRYYISSISNNNNHTNNLSNSNSKFYIWRSRNSNKSGRSSWCSRRGNSQRRNGNVSSKFAIIANDGRRPKIIRLF